MLSEKLSNNDRAWALYYRDHKSIREICEELGWELADGEALDANLRALVAMCEEGTAIRDKHIGALQRHVDWLMVQIEAFKHRVENDDKLLTNLADALDMMTGRKQAEAAAAKLAQATRVQFKRGGNWLQSVKLGLAECVWWAPLSLLQILREPVTLLGVASLAIGVRFFLWLWMRPKLLVMGFLGRVQPATVEG